MDRDQCPDSDGNKVRALSRDLEMWSVVEHLSSMQESLAFILSSTYTQSSF